MTEPYRPPYFDPLSTAHLTQVICRHFEESVKISLAAQIPRFDGSGLYAIYFVGDGGVYEPIAKTDVPVYVGRSISKRSNDDKRRTANLASRVRHHRTSIVGSELDAADFAVRLLLMPDVHTSMGEYGLINSYRPVWNTILTGFGGNIQGGNRDSSKSRWDTFHPGRNRPSSASAHDLATLKKSVETQIHNQSQLPNFARRAST